MKIKRYIRNGSEVLHDVHYSSHRRVCRFGSDEEPPAGYGKAYRELCRIATELSGVECRVDKISWTRKDGETRIRVDLSGGDSRGGTMKIVLADFGYNERARLVSTGDDFEENLEPVRINADEMEAFIAFERVLETYVQTGSGQLTFAWDQEVSDSVLQFTGQ